MHADNPLRYYGRRRPTDLAISSNSSRLTSSSCLPLAVSFSLILMTFSVIASWVSSLPPRRAKFEPVVILLCPSVSSPTPSMIALTGLR